MITFSPIQKLIQETLHQKMKMLDKVPSNQTGINEPTTGDGGALGTYNYSISNSADCVGGSSGSGSINGGSGSSMRVRTTDDVAEFLFWLLFQCNPSVFHERDFWDLEEQSHACEAGSV